jgi:RNA polymerase sigma-70 factor, ECF subfamily
MEEAADARTVSGLGRSGRTEDAALVRACVRGAPEAYQELLTRYRKSALTLAYQMLGNAEDAEDVAQEAFIRVFEAVHGFRGQAAFSTWLYRIVTNLCLGHLRARRPCVSLESLPDRGSSEGLSRQVTESLLTREVLALLPPELRAILLLREQGTLSYEEISQALGLPMGTVRSRLSKARASFREVWKQLAQSRDSEQ